MSIFPSCGDPRPSSGRVARTALAVGLLGAVQAVSAGAQSRVGVVPAPYALREANSSTVEPFRSSRGRLQQVIDPRRLAPQGLVVDAVSLRPENDLVARVTTATLRNVALEFGFTSRGLGQLGTRFADQRGNVSQVFRGNLALPARDSVPWTTAPFSIRVPFAVRQAFPTGPGRRLILEWRLRDPAAATPGYTFDGVAVGGNLRRIGATGQLPQFDRVLLLGEAGVPGGGRFERLVPGGSFEMINNAFIRPLSGVTLVGAGLREPGLDLGALGAPTQVLRVDRVVANLGFTMGGSRTGYSTVFPLLVPNDPVWAGRRLYAQTALALPGFNRLGVAMTNALEIVVGDAQPISRMLGADDPDAAVGAFVSEPVPVVAFEGQFF